MSTQSLRSFASDNYAVAAPEILNALAVCNAGGAKSYGNDDLSLAVEARLAG